MMRLNLTAAVVFLGLLHMGSSDAPLQCFKCDGDDHCKITVSCPGGSCVKKHNFDEDEDEGRFCSLTFHPEGSENMPKDDEYVKTFFCNTHLCNGAPPSSSLGGLSVMTMVALVVVGVVA